MATTFEIATRAAIEELITKHAQESKFGMILTREAFPDLVSDIYDLLQTSRNLKSAGDRFIRSSAPTPTPAPKRPIRST